MNSSITRFLVVLALAAALFKRSLSLEHRALQTGIIRDIFSVPNQSLADIQVVMTCYTADGSISSPEGIGESVLLSALGIKTLPIGSESVVLSVPTGLCINTNANSLNVGLNELSMSASEWTIGTVFRVCDETKVASAMITVD